MTGPRTDKRGSSHKPGELLQAVEDGLTARGFRVDRMPNPQSGLLAGCPAGTADPAVCLDSEVLVEDDGYFELRHWPRTECRIDPEKITELIADFLSRSDFREAGS